MSFADRLKILFDTRGKTLTAVADDIGITAATLSRYLNGIHEPDYKSLLKLSLYFDVSMDWLGGRVEDRRGTVITKDISVLYSIASDEDKKIVDLVLDKYKKAP